MGLPTLLLILRRIFCCGLPHIDKEEENELPSSRDGDQAITSDRMSSYYHRYKPLSSFTASDAGSFRNGSATGQMGSGNKSSAGSSLIIGSNTNDISLSAPGRRPYEVYGHFSAQFKPDPLPKPKLSKSHIYNAGCLRSPVSDPPISEALKVKLILLPKTRRSSNTDNHILSSNSSRVEIIEEQIKVVGKAVESKIMDYSSSQKILLVGEGDFSFSACLAQAFGRASNMTSTSLDSEAYLSSHYRQAMNNISGLRMRGCKVFHEIDATDMANHKMIKGHAFDMIVYNFPHVNDFSYTEIALSKHQRLVRLFMENAAKLIKNDGQVHIRHKSYDFYLKWDLKLLASQAGLHLFEEAPFVRNDFKGYYTKYGFEGTTFRSDGNFNCHTSKTYKFSLSKHQK